MQREAGRASHEATLLLPLLLTSVLFIVVHPPPQQLPLSVFLRLSTATQSHGSRTPHSHHWRDAPSDEKEALPPPPPMTTSVAAAWPPV